MAGNPGITGAEAWEKICIIDTENGSGSLYVGTTVAGLQIGNYNTIEIRPPFSPKNYLEAIRIAEKEEIEFLIIDSLTHAWTGEGGLLEIHGNVAERTKNSYTAWREVTPMHNQLVDKILQCGMHVCVCLRSKTEYVIEDGANGKKVPVKKGMAPIFRDGLEYECTTFFEIAQNHMACATKDRTGLFDGEFFLITPQTGTRINDWLGGAEKKEQAHALVKVTVPEGTITSEMVDKAIKDYCGSMDKTGKLAVAAEIRSITNGTVNCLEITDQQVLNLLYQKFTKQQGGNNS